MVGLGRVELPTSPLSGVRSNQLSYRPALRAPPPMNAGGSPKSHSVLRPMVALFQPRSQALNGFRGQRLNMLGSYATHDYRKNIDQKKKACIEFPALTE